MEKRYRKAVSVLIFRPALPAKEGESVQDPYEFLIVHKARKRDAWQLPQGGMEPGETIVETGRREVREETGIELNDHLHESACVYTYDFPKEFLKRYRPINAGQTLAFVSFLVPRDVVVTVDRREIDAYRWISFPLLTKYITRKEYVVVIDQVYRDSLACLLRSPGA